MKSKQSKRLSLSCRAYRHLLRVYPTHFRREYGTEMQQVFEDACHATLETGRLGAWLRFWTHILSDLTLSALKEHYTTMDRRTAFTYLLAFALGLLVGYLDFHSTEVQSPVAIILIVTFVFGFALPVRAWRWALLIGAGVPLCHIVNALLHRPPPYPVEPNVLATCLAFIPAFLGAYTGAFLRRLTLWTSSPA